MELYFTHKKYKIDLPKGFDVNKIRIGIPLENEEMNVLGHQQVGESIIPSPEFGPICEKNANGYFVINKNKPKEQRYITSCFIYPYGNKDRDQVLIDVTRKCYHRDFINPFEINIVLYEINNKKYLLANTSSKQIREHHLDIINMFIEIFGKCYIYDDINIDNVHIKQRVNWEILPPDTKPSVYANRNIGNKKNVKEFDVDRLKYIESFNYKSVSVGTNGYYGYYAYLFEKFCIFESPIYGNATYIVKSDNWEDLSKLTKTEVLKSSDLYYKIIHNKKWYNELEDKIKNIDILK